MCLVFLCAAGFTYLAHSLIELYATGPRSAVT